MILTKFGNFEDLFAFLEIKRDEIQAAFTQQQQEEEGQESQVLTEPDQEQYNMTIDKEPEYEKTNMYIVHETPKAKCIQQPFLSSQDSTLQFAWSTSLETPIHNATDTTMIMEQLALKDVDLNEELIEEYCDYDIDLDLDIDLVHEEDKDPLGLDSLAFPMSQFPVSEADSLELLDELISEFDLSHDDHDYNYDDGIEKSLNEEAEFDLDISMSQFPSTQIAMQSVDAIEDHENGHIEPAPVLPVVIVFTTGRGTAMAPPSKEAIKRARSLVELDEATELFDEKENEQCNIDAAPFQMPMFTTGRGKAIPPPTEEAIKRARSMIETAVTEIDEKEADSDQEKYNSVPTRNITDSPVFPAFTTAKGKTLPPPSKEALDRANKLISEDEVDGPKANVGFSTGRGKAMKPPSGEAWKRAQELVGENDVDMSKVNVGFSTGRGKAMKAPSEDALKRAQELVGESEPVISKPKLEFVKKPLVPGNSAFKPPTRLSTSSTVTTTLEAPANPPAKPFSLSNAWKRPRPRPAAVAPKIKPAPPPQVQLFDLNVDGMTRFKLRDFFKTPPNLSLTPEEYQSYGITNDILEMDSEKAKKYRFDGWGPVEAHKCLIESGAQSVSVSEAWTANHYRWIIWKFASFIRAFPEQYSSANLSPSWVLSQLLYRYEREVHLCHRSAVKKIVERDDAASKLLCLIISRIDLASGCLELSDGWYSIWTGKLDSSFWELVERGRLREGMKIEISGAVLTGQEAIPALDASLPTCPCRLTIARNSCRPAKWDTKLGFIKSVAFLKKLQHVHERGGPIPAISVLVDRVYPILFREERQSDTSKNTVKRNERDHYLYLESNAEQAQNSKFTPLQRIRVRGPANSVAVVSFWNPLGEDQQALLQEGTAVIITNLRAKNENKVKSLVSSKATRLFRDSLPAEIVPHAPIVIKLGSFDGFKELKVSDSFDVSGVSLSRSGNYFWIGWIDGTCKILACIRHFTAPLAAGELVNFRDLCFDHFDCKEGVAHFTFNEYSDFKRGGSSNSVTGFKASQERFKELTQINQ